MYIYIYIYIYMYTHIHTYAGSMQPVSLRRVQQRWDAQFWDMVHGVGRLFYETVSLRHHPTGDISQKSSI